VERKLNDVIASRGKRNTDPTKQADILRRLVPLAETPLLRVTCMLLLVAVQFDRAISLVNFLPAAEWTTYAAALGDARPVRLSATDTGTVGAAC
jgi:hypothetical protein